MAKREMPTANEEVVEDVNMEKKNETKETKPKKKSGIAKGQ